ncbi:MAG: nitrilase-related carbon-nitrogen hydrolase [Thermoguttaceae bacterium]
MAFTTAQDSDPSSARDRLRVAAVQMKFAPTIAENLAKIEQLLDEAARRRADAVLLPECATTGYAYDYSRLKPAEIASALATVGRIAARLQLYVLIGSPVFRRRSLYNCLVRSSCDCRCPRIKDVNGTKAYTVGRCPAPPAILSIALSCIFRRFP